MPYTSPDTFSQRLARRIRNRHGRELTPQQAMSGLLWLVVLVCFLGLSGVVWARKGGVAVLGFAGEMVLFGVLAMVVMTIWTAQEQWRKRRQRQIDRGDALDEGPVPDYVTLAVRIVLLGSFLLVVASTLFLFGFVAFLCVLGLLAMGLTLLAAGLSVWDWLRKTRPAADVDADDDSGAADAWKHR